MASCIIADFYLQDACPFLFALVNVTVVKQPSSLKHHGIL